MKRAASPSLWVLLTACVVLVAGQGCKPNTRDNPNACGFTKDDGCPVNLSCDYPSHTCVPNDAGAAGQGVGGDGTGGAGPGGGGDAGDGTAGGGAGGGAAGLGGTSPDGGMDGPTIQCQTNKDCAGKTGTLACDPASNTCVECIDPSTCGGTTPICDGTKHACVECTALDTSCTGAKPVCNTKTSQCVACVADVQCTTAGATFCSKDNVCIGCAGAGMDACPTRDPNKPVCATSGDCVECDTDKDCHGPAPFCGPQKTCQSCMEAGGDGACAGLNGGAKPFCGSSGACVQCAKDSDCSPTSTTPLCSDAGSCVSCAVGANRCMTVNPKTPACALSGACVECVANSDCPDSKPVCSPSNACVACTADTDCSGRGPGVCMSHLDGRCASDKETMYVQNKTGCADSGGSAAGSANTPFCTMQPTTALISATRDLVLVRGTVTGASGAFVSNVSIVGQSSASIGSVTTPALHVASGTTYARNLKLFASDSIGLRADSGSTVQLDHILVTGNTGQAMDGNGGGILLDGAAFDIRNTTVTNNGPGALGNNAWGGILVNSLPASGPKSLRLVTVQGNNSSGISCPGPISGTGVLATSNTSIDILPACMIMSCGTASMTCGAQP